MDVRSGALRRKRGQPLWASFRENSHELRHYLLMVGIIVSIAWLMSCSGGGSSSSSGSTPGTTAVSLAGIELPAEISAVPPAEDATGRMVASSNLSLRSNLRALTRAAGDSGTDYSEATTSKYVEEHTLEQFNIIEQVLGALNQTHFADAENINNGAYKCIVAWEDEQDGIEVKGLEPWIVQSDQIVEDGQDLIRARAWIEEQEEDGTQLVKAEFKVFESATKNDDGSYEDYGVWEVNVKFDESGEDFFAASVPHFALGSQQPRF